MATVMILEATAPAVSLAPLTVAKEDVLAIPAFAYLTNMLMGPVTILEDAASVVNFALL